MRKIGMTVIALALVAAYAGCEKGKDHAGMEGHGQAMEAPVDKVISMMDTDHDGKVSKEEFRAHFSVKDKDGNGLISKDEMREHHIEVHGNDEKFGERFDMTDTNKDGNVDEDECMAKFARMDENGDDFLEKGEFQKRMMGH